ncbi:hypothetical protein FJQ87_08785 [Shewanella sp. SNU WT4]|uniref:phosphotransferase family protein n=1 Tax=Shewanella sp. SNU WT4 TaxID=2590015 RepID=UPI00112A5BC1|nr:phosphotransferase [Shewanella sp. SNU WT4]QDF66793.1 hypothetical protein FJQ87_08785 [Shewanella sp. SNU WT4]
MPQEGLLWQSLLKLLARHEAPLDVVNALGKVLSHYQLALTATPQLLTSGLNNINVLLFLGEAKSRSKTKPKPPALTISVSELDFSREHISHQELDCQLGLRWVLRCNLIKPLDARQNEVKAWRQAAAVNLAPPLHWVSADFQCYLSEYCPAVNAAAFGAGFADVDGLTSSTKWRSQLNTPTINAMGQGKANKSKVNNGKSSKVKDDSRANEDLCSGLASHQVKLLDSLLQLSQISQLSPLSHLPQLSQSSSLSQSLAQSVPTNCAAARGNNLSHQIEQYLSALTALAPCSTWTSAQQQSFAGLARAFKDYGSDQSAQWRELDQGFNWQQFSHRDLHPDNLLLQSDSVYVIDFEFSCDFHPLWDLTSIIATCEFTDTEAFSFCQAYLARHPHFSGNEMVLIPAMLDCYWFTASIWALNQACDSCDAEFLDWSKCFWQLVSK